MAHIHESIDFVVNAFIVYDDKVLLINHKKLKKWLSIGGHIELNENPEEALFREIKEECGLDVDIIGGKPNMPGSKWPGFKPLYNPMFLDVHDISETHKHVALNYFLKAKSDKYIFNKEEHNDIRWFSKEDLEKPEFDVPSEIKFYANEALKAVKNK
ncbi:MAG: NUDIX domain-containing protein [Candidatus Staskawiczbacteria bacterium]|nr:NUDIX domain-containing protein [Candidatus Staskawiczbacteria bacterium]